MDHVEYQMHLDLGRAYGQEATCGTKIDYRSEFSADRAATSMNKKADKPLEAYPCAWCDGWHIGRALSEEEKQQYLSDTLTIEVKDAATGDCRDLECRAHGRYLRRIRRLTLAVAALRAETSKVEIPVLDVFAADQEAEGARYAAAVEKWDRSRGTT